MIKNHPPRKHIPPAATFHTFLQDYYFTLRDDDPTDDDVSFADILVRMEREHVPFSEAKDIAIQILSSFADRKQLVYDSMFPDAPH